MQLIPAIDLRGGKVVRLEQGDYARETRYQTDPLVLAERYAVAGARLIHVVDLDSARHGGEANLPIIENICRQLSVSVQTGGGVRSWEDYKRRLDAGAARVVVGSLCVQQPRLICQWLEQGESDRLVAGLDVARSIDGGWLPRAAGWTQEGHDDLFTLLAQLIDAGLQHLLCTDIDRDGVFTGPSVELYRALCEGHPALEIQASGGIAKAGDLVRVSATGVAGCIVGRALLEGRIHLGEINRWSR